MSDSCCSIIVGGTVTTSQYNDILDRCIWSWEVFQNHEDHLVIEITTSRYASLKDYLVENRISHIEVIDDADKYLSKKTYYVGEENDSYYYHYDPDGYICVPSLVIQAVLDDTSDDISLREALRKTILPPELTRFKVKD